MGLRIYRSLPPPFQKISLRSLELIRQNGGRAKRLNCRPFRHCMREAAMAEFAELFDGMRVRVTCDEDAIPTARVFCTAFDSVFLPETVLQTYIRDGKPVRMLDHLNLVFTLEEVRSKRGRTVVSFVFAELEDANKLARLHVLYTLRSYRKQGHGRRILRAFDDVLARGSYERVLVAPTSHHSLKLFTEHASTSRLNYDVVRFREAILLEGDSAPD